MTQQNIDVGDAPNDGTGDPLQTAFIKSNENFTELYAKGASEGIWNFDATSSDTSTAPVSGRFKTSSGNYRDATQIAIHAITMEGIDRASTLRTLLVGDIVQCQDRLNAPAWCRYDLQSPPVDNGTWFQLSVALQADGGIASGNNQEIVFGFTAGGGEGTVGPAGPAGPQGPQGPQGVPGADGTSDWAGITNKPATFPPTLPIPESGVTNLVSDLALKAPLASPALTGNPTAPTPTAGDNDTSLATTAFVQAEMAAQNIAPQCGYLQWVSITQIKFAPKNGSKVKIAGQIYSIPAAGITSANTSMFYEGSTLASFPTGANTAYLVALFINAGVPVIEFWRTIHVHGPDDTPGNVGVEVLSGAKSRTIIGMVIVGAGAGFGGNFYTLSWFNRINKVFAASLGNLSTASLASVPLGPSQLFVSWGEEAPRIEVAGQANTDAGQFAFVGAGVDGAQFAANQYVYGSAVPFPCMVGGNGNVSEGLHSASLLLGATSGGAAGINNTNMQITVRG